MTLPAAPPAGPARTSPETNRNPAAQDPRRAARFAALLGRGARPDARRPTGPPPRGRARGEAAEERAGRDAADGGAAAMPTPAAGLAPLLPSPGLPSAVGTVGARVDADLAAAAAHVVESVQVGLDRAGQAEVRFDVADGPLKGLEVRMLAAPGGIEARFVAEDAAARRALVEPLLELQRTLADQGITVARLEVAVRADVGGHGSGRGHAEGAPAPVAAPAGHATSTASGVAAGLPLLRAGSPTDWIA
jgi:hypothetical protein